MLSNALRMIYPDHCLTCNALVDTSGAICGECWADTPFITGLICDTCGTPLPGDPEEEKDDVLLCDDCMSTPRPWKQGRSALRYDGKARKLVLGLKHGDRGDLAAPMAGWMARVAEPLLQPGCLIVPVAMRRSRLFRRRFNQSALLARALGKVTGHQVCNDLLQRITRTESLDGKSKEQRFAMLANTIRVNPRRINNIQDRPVVLIDDVMTSGATLTACSEALIAAGCKDVNILVLARVAKYA